MDSGGITGTVDCNSQDNSRSKDILIIGLSCLSPFSDRPSCSLKSSDLLLFTDIQQAVS